MKKITMLFPIILLFAASFALAGIEFYSGNVKIEVIDAAVDIKDTASVNIQYVLRGYGNIALEFMNVPDNAEITVKGQKYGKKFQLQLQGQEKIYLKYSEEIEPWTNKKFSLNPTLLFNGMLNSNPVALYQIKIIMPSGTKELLHSSIEPGYIGKNNGRNEYIWTGLNSYFTSLLISWHTLDVDLNVQRIIPPYIENEFVVNNLIENNGKELKDVRIVQTFLESDIEAIEPKAEFKIIQGGNDLRLEWEKKIPILIPGRHKFSYRVKAKESSTGTIFRPLYIYAGDTLIKIVDRQEYLSDSLDGTKFSAEDETLLRKPTLSINISENEKLTYMGQMQKQIDNKPGEFKKTQTNAGQQIPRGKLANGTSIAIITSIAGALILLFLWARRKR